MVVVDQDASVSGSDPYEGQASGDQVIISDAIPCKPSGPTTLDGSSVGHSAWSSVPPVHDREVTSFGERHVSTSSEEPRGCIATMSNQLAIATCPNFLATMSIQLGIAKCPNQLKNQLVHVLATMSTLGIANRSNQLMHHLVGRYSNPTNHTGSFAKPTFVPMDLEEPATLRWSGRESNFP